jgi:hypothetical protein
MNTATMDKNQFISTASDFFNELFEPAFISQRGNIEIRAFPKGQAPQQYFLNSESAAAEKAYQLLTQNIDVYFGVNPRIGNGGKKENVHYLSAFHAEIDYGTTGHKKQSIQAPWKSRKGGGGNGPSLRTGWLNFHDRKWLTSKRPLTTTSDNLSGRP